MKYDIFVSYSRNDSDIVKRFVNRFEMEGLRVWVDREGIETGDAFKQVIVKAIKESSILVFFSSKNSNASPWTAKEIGLAVNHGKPIIPVKIDNSMFNEEVEFDLIGLDYIDYTNPATQGSMMEKLVRSVKRKQYMSSSNSFSSSWHNKSDAGTESGRKPSWTTQGASYWTPAQAPEKNGGWLIAVSIFFTILGGFLAIVIDIILLSNVTINGVKYHKYNKKARTVAIVSLILVPFSFVFWLLL